jgi:hypothetical protein
VRAQPAPDLVPAGHEAIGEAIARAVGDDGVRQCHDDLLTIGLNDAHAARATVGLNDSRTGRPRHQRCPSLRAIEGA